MSCTVSCCFVRGLGERYVCRAHPNNPPHVCHVSVPCSAARVSPFDGQLTCPISGRVFRGTNDLDLDLDGGADRDRDSRSNEDAAPAKPRALDGVAAEIEDTVRELVAVAETVFARERQHRETHVEAYAQELLRLWSVYDGFARASARVAPTTPRAFVMGALYLMLSGLAVGGTVVMPRDEFLKRIYPNSAQIETLTRGAILRRHATAGTRFVLECLNAAAGHDKSKRELAAPATQTNVPTSFVARAHEDVVREVCRKRNVQTHLLMRRKRTKTPTPLCYEPLPARRDPEPLFPFVAWIG